MSIAPYKEVWLIIAAKIPCGLLCHILSLFSGYREAVQREMGSRGWCGLHYSFSHKRFGSANF